MTLLLLLALQTEAEDWRTIHLLNRLTPAATPERVERVRAVGIEAWLAEQLKGEAKESPLSGFETLDLTGEEVLRDYVPRLPATATPKEQEEANRKSIVPARETLDMVIRRAVGGQNPVRETMADFFRNHFAVSVEKDDVRYHVVSWERDVIRTHALGSFGRMLESTAKHPAMLIFLDNYLSRRDPTPQELRQLEMAAKRARFEGGEAGLRRQLELALQRGLNENYARELLELHTLGVDNGYTQKDVIGVAQCLTGWSIGGEYRGSFEFHPNMHAAGAKPFLGDFIPENKTNPLAEGEAVLWLLLNHKGTARFLSWKLCRFLVSDTPDEKMVKRVADVFHKTKGDIPKVITAIVEDREFFSKDNYRAKFKRPWEYVISALAVTKAEIAETEGIHQALAAMNEPLYRCADPTGFYDQAEAWRDPGAMATRWTFAAELVSGRVPGVKIPDSLYAELPTDDASAMIDALAERIVPGGIDVSTKASIERMLDNSPRRQQAPRIVAALLGSPEFQKQ